MPTAGMTCLASISIIVTLAREGPVVFGVVYSNVVRSPERGLLSIVSLFETLDQGETNDTK